MSKFNEGLELSYAELPVEANYLYWKRGNVQLEHLKDSDPGAFLGGWLASVENKDGEKYPVLTIPIVSRKSDDGKVTYQRYASNVISFLPIASRMRYELRQRIKTSDGREEEKVVTVVKEYVSGVTIGYQPNKQVFGLLFSLDGKMYAPAVLKLNKWSSFLSFSKSAKTWAKIKTPDNKALVRRYGTLGVVNQKSVLPNFEVFNDGRSTPIEAIGIESPFYIDVTPELDALWDGSQDWAKCEKWNASVVAKNIDILPVLPETSEEFPFGDTNQE